MFSKILSSYGISSVAIIQPFGSGLINNTWRITDGEHEFILQRINERIFTQPEDISYNIEVLAKYLNQVHPDYFFVTPLKTLQSEPLLRTANDGCFRVFPFVQGSVTYNVAQTSQLAFQAGEQFGLFTKMLASFPAATLKTTLPDFHNLLLRYRQFESACTSGDARRSIQSKNEIEFLQQYHNIVATYEKITKSAGFKLRVTHHDTKISNVLFDQNCKGICVIDLDTVMPGYFISDIGDMMRTYLSPTNEEDDDFAKIEIREEYFKAILQGYLNQMNDELSHEEKNHFVYAGMFMIYMQALRFLTDHLNNDAYYGAVYTGQNYMRACNQIVLLKQLLKKETALQKIVSQTLNS